MKTKEPWTYKKYRRSCNRCDVEKPFEDFPLKSSASNYRLPWCKKCDAKRKADWYTSKHEHNLKRMAKWRKDTRDAAVVILGGFCACCGESRKSMLELDHVKNDGSTHRRKVKWGNYKVYQDIIDSGGDRTKYQVLCANCNQSKRRNGGFCEHISDLDALLAQDFGLG